MHYTRGQSNKQSIFMNTSQQYVDLFRCPFLYSGKCLFSQLTVVGVNGVIALPRAVLAIEANNRIQEDIVTDNTKNRQSRIAPIFHHVSNRLYNLP